jgi:CHAT domain-containing protein
MRLDAVRPGQGFDRAALEASERARARTLLDVLRASGPGIRTALAPDLLARRRDLERRLALKADRRQTLLGSGRQAPELKVLEGDIERAAAELDLLDTEIRKQDPRYAGLVQAEAASAREIQALLDPGTLLLEYSLGRERSYVWAVGPESLRAFVLPGRAEIERAARALHEALSVPPGGGDRSRLGSDLGRMLLGPLASALGDRRLAVVADGALHYIPFEVLPEPGDPSRPLLFHHEIVALPSASALAASRRSLGLRAPAPRLAMVLADPVFSSGDSRVPRHPRASAGGDAKSAGARGDAAIPALGRLRFSRREAEEIAALAPPGALATELDFAASRDLLLSGRLRDYRYVHLATHGVFDTARPDLSGLVLSRVGPAGDPREGFVGLRDIYGLDLSADLVVLSGCQTALGREIRGEGLLGLTRGFLYAGAPRVVASLWWVDDRATAELMARFYRGLWRENLPPAAALRKARLSLAGEPRFRDPFYWGSFVLQGEWR